MRRCSSFLHQALLPPISSQEDRAICRQASSAPLLLPQNVHLHLIKTQFSHFTSTVTPCSATPASSPAAPSSLPAIPKEPQPPGLRRSHLGGHLLGETPSPFFFSCHLVLLFIRAPVTSQDLPSHKCSFPSGKTQATDRPHTHAIHQAWIPLQRPSV